VKTSLEFKSLFKERAIASSGWLREQSSRQNLYKLFHSVQKILVLKSIFQLSVLLCFNMVTVNMNNVGFYNPNLPSKPLNIRLTRLVMDKQRPPLQPIKLQPVTLLRRSQNRGRGTLREDQRMTRHSISEYN
jgi:hypothetical protein